MADVPEEGKSRLCPPGCPNKKPQQRGFTNKKTAAARLYQ